MRLSGEVADGTVIAEGRSPQDLANVRQLIDDGRARAGRTDSHRLTVFAGFYIGDPSALGDPPLDSPPGWAAIGVDAASVAARLQGLIDAGADAVILVPFGDDIAPQLHLASAEVIPRLVR